MDKIKVYIKLGKNNTICEIESSVFLKDTEGYLQIDEGYGQKYAHAQNYYFPKDKPLRDNQGRCNYKYVSNIIQQLSENEKNELYPNNIIVSEQDNINSMVLKEIEALKNEINKLRGDSIA